PTMVSGPVTSKSPAKLVLSSPTRVAVYLPVGNRIVSGPGLALARRIASRRETTPGGAPSRSSVVFTANVAGTRRVSRPSRLGRNDLRMRFFMGDSLLAGQRLG